MAYIWVGEGSLSVGKHLVSKGEKVPKQLPAESLSIFIDNGQVVEEKKKVEKPKKSK